MTFTIQPKPYWVTTPLSLALAAYALFHGHGVLPGKTGPISVLVVYDAENVGKLTAGQRAVIEANDDKSVKHYLAQPGREFEFIDKDSDMALAAPKFQEARKLVKSIPWVVVIKSGGGMVSGEMPATEEATFALLRKYGGP